MFIGLVLPFQSCRQTNCFLSPLGTKESSVIQYIPIHLNLLMGKCRPHWKSLILRNCISMCFRQVYHWGLAYILKAVQSRLPVWPLSWLTPDKCPLLFESLASCCAMLETPWVYFWVQHFQMLSICNCSVKPAVSFKYILYFNQLHYMAYSMFWSFFIWANCKHFL